MFKTVDLFAGAGGLSYGFEATDKFRIVAAAENNENASKTYALNHKGKNKIMMISDVRGYDFKGLKEELGGVDVVIGGPPCQGFSNANRQKNHIISMNNSLVKEFFRAIKEMQPRAFVMENVSMLSSDKHRFYDSYVDHDEVIRLGVPMRVDELVIADENYDGVNCFHALNQADTTFYRISDELLQLLNVLYKDRKSKEGRLEKYISKNSDIIRAKIDDFFRYEHYDYKILKSISELLESEELKSCFDELGRFIKFQKSFRLLDELKSNQIIYTLYQDLSGKITAQVESYSVIDYVNIILGDSYIKNSAVINSLWFGVPQERKRFIMIGIKPEALKGGQIKMPDGSGTLPEIIDVDKAIMDLAIYTPHTEADQDEVVQYSCQERLSDYAKKMREGSTGIKNHIIPNTRETAMERFQKLKEGENFHKLGSELKENYADPERTQNSIYLRLDRFKPSGTVTNVRKAMWIHPTLDRAISVREAARLQSFPDKFVFEGPKNSQYQQVGNAVPPMMAQGIAEVVLKHLKRKYNKV